MGGPNLEVFKVSQCCYTLRPSSITNPTLIPKQFGMYIMFPIGWMYYFGTNLDSRFSTPDFWPKPGQTHVIPFEKDEIAAELERLKSARLATRQRRLEAEARGQETEVTQNREEQEKEPRREILEAVKVEEPERSQVARSRGWGGWFS